MKSIFEELNAARTACLAVTAGDVRNRINGIFERLTASCKALCDESDAKHAEECKLLKAQVQEQYQDHIDDLTVELANCREVVAADRQTIQHLVAVVNKLVK